MSEILERCVNHIIGTKDYRCRKCGSLIRFGPNDVMVDQRQQRHVDCPVCNTWIDASVVGL